MKYSPFLAILALVHGSLLSRQGTRVDNGGHPSVPQTMLVQTGMSQPQLPLSRPPLPGELPQVPATPSFSDQLPPIPGMPATPKWAPQPGYSLPQVPMQNMPGLPTLGPNFEVPAPVGDAGDALPPLPPLPELPALPPDLQNSDSFIQPAAQAPPMSQMPPIQPAAQAPPVSQMPPIPQAVLPAMQPSALGQQSVQQIPLGLPVMTQNVASQQLPRAPDMSKLASQKTLAAGRVGAPSATSTTVHASPKQQLLQQPEQQVNLKASSQVKLPKMLDLPRQQQRIAQPEREISHPQNTKGQTFLASQVVPVKHEIASQPKAQTSVPSNAQRTSGGSKFLAHDQPPRQNQQAPVLQQQQVPQLERQRMTPLPTHQEPLETKTILAATQMDEISKAPLPMLDNALQSATPSPVVLAQSVQMPPPGQVAESQSTPSVFPNSVAQAQLAAQSFVPTPPQYGQNFPAPSMPAMQMQPMPQNASMGYQYVPNLGYGGPQGLPMFGQMPLGVAPPPSFSPYSNFGPMAGGAGKVQTLNALQMPPAQNQMVAAIQAQYSAQLEQYNEQQKQFSDWAKRYQQYEQNLAAEQQQYQLQQQQYQSFVQQQRQVARSPRAALVQTDSRSESAREATLKSRELALAARGKTLAGRESALRQETEKVRAEEVREANEKANLDARQTALAAKEKQVQIMESQLIQEQRKIWKVLKSRQAAPPQPASAARPAVATAIQRRSKQPRLAFAQTSSATKARRASATRNRIKVSSTASRVISHSNADAMAKRGSEGSDVHIVTAAKVAPDFDDEDAPLPADSKATEDDAAGTTETSSSATSDNDDLEQILLQQSSNVRGNGDPVESS